VTEELPGDEEQSPRRKPTLSARNMAMNWLARREHSLAELRAKLADREFPSEVIAATVDGLAADNLVSDERFAEAFVAARMRKGQGPVRIRMDLKRRGVASELIGLHLDESGLDWRALASEVRRKKFGMEIPADFKEKARQMRFLEYRGFRGAHIRAALGDDFD
jgi:regulatory protein